MSSKVVLERIHWHRSYTSLPADTESMLRSAKYTSRPDLSRNTVSASEVTQVPGRTEIAPHHPPGPWR